MTCHPGNQILTTDALLRQLNRKQCLRLSTHTFPPSILPPTVTGIIAYPPADNSATDPSMLGSQRAREAAELVVGRWIWYLLIERPWDGTMRELLLRGLG